MRRVRARMFVKKKAHRTRHAATCSQHPLRHKAVSSIDPAVKPQSDSVSRHKVGKIGGRMRMRRVRARAFVEKKARRTRHAAACSRHPLRHKAVSDIDPAVKPQGDSVSRHKLAE